MPLIEAGVDGGTTPPTAVDITTAGGVVMKVATAICFDFDFPDLFSAAGAAGVDLLVGPSEWHSYSVYLSKSYCRSIQCVLLVVAPHMYTH